MSQPRSDSELAERGPRQRSPWLLVVACVTLVGLSLLAYVLRDFADPEHIDTSPLPRVPKNAPFIKSPDRVVLEMIKAADVTEKDLVYDLGCGDGRIVITAAMERGCRGIGFDIDPERVAEARENVRKHGVEELVTIQQQDIFQVDLSQANVIVMYLLPWMVDKLVPQFERCPPGTRIVSHDFWISDLKFDEQIEVDLGEVSREPHYVYVYITPLKKGKPEFPKLPR